MTAPITDAGLAETVAAVKNWHSRVAKYKNAIRNNEALSGPVKYASERVASAYSDMTRLLVENALPVVHRLRTSEARVAELAAEILKLDDVVHELGIEDTNDDPAEVIAKLWERAEKAEAEVARLVADQPADEYQYQRNIAAAFRAGAYVFLKDGPRDPQIVDAADEYASTHVRLRAASSPDPAQPGQSSAQPAVGPKEVLFGERAAKLRAENESRARIEATGLRMSVAARLAVVPAPDGNVVTAAERNICKICDGTNFVHGVDGLTVCPVCVGATPPAAGSAAGMGGGS